MAPGDGPAGCRSPDAAAHGGSTEGPRTQTMSRAGRPGGAAAGGASTALDCGGAAAEVTACLQDGGGVAARQAASRVLLRALRRRRQPIAPAAGARAAAGAAAGAAMQAVSGHGATGLAPPGPRPCTQGGGAGGATTLPPSPAAATAAPCAGQYGRAATPPAHPRLRPGAPAVAAAPSSQRISGAGPSWTHELTASNVAEHGGFGLRPSDHDCAAVMRPYLDVVHRNAGRSSKGAVAVGPPVHCPGIVLHDAVTGAGRGREREVKLSLYHHRDGPNANARRFYQLSVRGPYAWMRRDVTCQGGCMDSAVCAGFVLATLTAERSRHIQRAWARVATCAVAIAPVAGGGGLRLLGRMAVHPRALQVTPSGHAHPQQPSISRGHRAGAGYAACCCYHLPPQTNAPRVCSRCCGARACSQATPSPSHA